MDNTFYPPPTSCSGCIWNESDNCRLDRLDLYRSKNIKMIEKKGQPTEFIEFICPYHRTEEWLQHSAPTGQPFLQYMRNENMIPYMTVMLGMGKHLLGASIRRLKQFKHKPNRIIVVTSADDPEITPHEMHDILGETTPWTIINELEENGWFNLFKNYNQTDFMLLVTGYPYAPTDWAKQLSYKIQDELITFPYAENKKRTMTFIPAYFYNSYYYDYGTKWLEKLREERWRQKYTL